MKLYYREAGAGQPMILLHGNGEDSSYFEQQMTYFSKKYRVIAVDTRGHGKSPRGTRPFTLSQFADDLRSFLDRKGLRRVILFGFSDGGNIALLFALKYPAYVDRMIINGANLTPMGVKLRYQLVDTLKYAALSAVIPAVSCIKIKSKQKWIRKKELLGLMVKEPFLRWKDLRRIKMPVLVIAGSNDMIKERHTKAICRALPGGRLRILKGSHFIAAEQPQSFNRAVDAFLRATQGGEDKQMRRLWGNRTPGRLDQKRERHSSVLVPLVKKNGEYHVLFEIRADKLKHQPGEVCFPGGAVEKGETKREAAIRETMEELLVERRQIKVLAPLDILITPGNLTIWPFLAVLHDYHDTCSKDEVARVFTVPVKWFIEHEPERYQTKVATTPGEDFPFEWIPDGKGYNWRSGKYEVLFYANENAVIWGMTAKILHSFISMYRNDMLS